MIFFFLNIFSEIVVLKIDPDPNQEIAVIEKVELVQDRQVIKEIMV
jgi:hypothetical protein